MIRRQVLQWTLMGLVSLSAGCATVDNPDPLEPVNRKVFAFNEAVDDAVLKPVATGYRKHVPEPLRVMTGSFFGNLADAWSAFNLVLQGRPVDAVRESLRFLTNSIFGVLGLADVATPMGLERYGEDFGQTLGKWGFGPGAYLVLPILGPSSARDALGLPVETSLTPTAFVSDPWTQAAMTALNVTDRRSRLLGATGMLDEVSLDKYTFVRSAYLQRRLNLVYDGNPPEVPDEAAEPASAASSPR